MKRISFKKIVLVGFLSIGMLSAFFTPATTAQEWNYNGADTLQIPSHSVYPSEWYIYNTTSNAPDQLIVLEISHGNISDPGLGDSYCVWANRYYQNITTGGLEFLNEILSSSWDDIIGYQGTSSLAPIGVGGTVSQSMLDGVKDYYGGIMTPGSFEFNQSYLGSYSFAFWNETGDDSYLHFNYTSDGILMDITWYYTTALFLPNQTLVSRPAQLPPVFSFTTEDGILNINSSSTKLNVSITDADNNNDGIVDTSYKYRMLVGSTWTNWTAIPPLIDYNLSSIASGAHQITMEVKNMYGVTQEQVTIQYTPPTIDPTGDTPNEAIPGFSPMIIGLILLLGASVMMFRYRKQSKNRQ